MKRHPTTRQPTHRHGRQETCQETTHCEQCIHAEYDYTFANLSIYGEPTLLSCKYYPHPKQVIGHTKTCQHFTNK